MSRHALILGTLLAVLACNGSDPANGTREPDAEPALPPGEVPTWSYRIVNVFPHDTDAYTQGLVFADGHFLEGTGGGTRLGSRNLLSSLRRVAIETGEVLEQVTLDERFFGEGITLLDGLIYQLTWKSRVGFVYDDEGLVRTRQFAYAAQDTTGWGLTHDGERLWMSDGSSDLTIRDPETFAETGRVVVQHKDQPVRRLNELEWIEGEIWANLFTTDIVARINPMDGLVVGWVDLRGLLTSSERQQTDVLNGIAYDPATKRIFVTGKLWPWVFQIELIGG
ncbi:MAG TPA: glutaminyl-peptide cyclotransferase [Candidatus Latescibacteria bacterium]|jgi:glutamine cyclotransferase|nr:glutamine cyclotransferase [Gemmatimonadaceae bacterium]MDP6015634.1 glutaminyl-peptide cyclotransferase [Candidatus Latescibacterota bacterium]HJP29212.1 glutaminyl-peptide cyclotransferase [Candidatus Latescibacterota bacterium]